MDKTFDAATAEARIYSAWEERGCFRAGANARPGAPAYCIMIPPPNVTGSLHIGHAFNNTLQDILVRWHRMRGFDTLWQPGTDHAGIATQMVTEREMAANGEPGRIEMGRKAFISRVWQQKVKSRGTIIGQLKRLGASCDWEREAFTMGGAPGDPEAGSGPDFHDAVIAAFVRLYQRGLIYRGKRLVNWDPHFQSAISDLEVENVEVDGNMWHFKYPLAGGATYEYVERDADGRETLREVRDYISIATTRPETMLGDGAVAVHPGDARYAPIVGSLCEIPVGPRGQRRKIPIITDEYPDPDFGSGAVKITGAHDFNDYRVARRAGLPMYRLMDVRGAMRNDGAAYAECAARAQEIADGADFTPEEVDRLNLVPDDLRGLDRFEARQRVIETITAEGLAVMRPAADDGVDGLQPLIEHKPIVQPVGDRSKVVIEPMLTDQWFVDTSRIVQPAIDAVERGETCIMPDRDRRVYLDWLGNLEPWCISRQLWWGHRIPVWFDDDGNQICATSEEEAQAAAPGKRLTRDPDVLDTWFSSALWPAGTLGWPEKTREIERYFPTSTLVTGFDIIFFWVARMMMMHYALLGQRPFSHVYVHALVRDAKGQKMSKSLGNVLDPLELIDDYGADALRFTLASMAAMGRDVRLSTERIAGARNFTTKLWNAVRYAYMNGVHDAPPSETTLPKPAIAVNRWIMGETARVCTAVDAALESWRFNEAADRLYGFVWGRVCDWYIELAKPMLLASGSGTAGAREETRQVMRWVLDQCLIMLHPMMPFVTEELWQITGERPKMLIHADWPGWGREITDQSADREVEWVISVIEGIRSVRNALWVPAGAVLDAVATEMDTEAESFWTNNSAGICRLARVSGIKRVDELPEGAVTVPMAGIRLALQLQGVIDARSEQARLEKELARIGGKVAGLQQRLGSPGFVAAAPEAVIEETRNKLAMHQGEIARVKDALARLKQSFHVIVCR